MLALFCTSLDVCGRISLPTIGRKTLEDAACITLLVYWEEIMASFEISKWDLAQVLGLTLTETEFDHEGTYLWQVALNGKLLYDIHYGYGEGEANYLNQAQWLAAEKFFEKLGEALVKIMED